MVNKADEIPRRAVLVFVDEAPEGAESQSSLFLMLRYWKLMVACAAIAGIGAISYCLMTPKWYRAQSLIAVVRQEANGSALGPLGGEIGGLASLVGLDIGDSEDQKKETLARLSSREFTYAFIRTEGLLPILFADRWDSKARHWSPASREPSMEDAYRFFTETVFSVSEDRRTGLIKIAVDWIDPPLAQSWANKLVAHINADRRTVAKAETERNLEFLSRELEHTSIVELRQAINRMVESEIRKRMLVNVSEQYAFKVIDPAFMPGPRAVVRPRIVLLTAMALAIGASLGGCIGLILHHRRRAALPT